MFVPDQLGVARHTVLNDIRTRKRKAVQIVQAKRPGLRVAIHSGEQGLLPDAELPVWP